MAHGACVSPPWPNLSLITSRLLTEVNFDRFTALKSQCPYLFIYFYTGVRLKVMGSHFTRSTARMAKERRFADSIMYSNRAVHELYEYW